MSTLTTKTIELNTLINADCMDIMPMFPDDYFELAIVDPPYGIGAAKMQRGRSVIKPDKTKTWDDVIPDNDYFAELRRVSVNQVIWGGNYYNMPPTRGFIIWDKGESMYGRSFAECEYAYTSFDVSARMFKHTPNDSNRIHPTQKPVKLYEWILTNYAKQGDKILDTHAGSASSLIACHNLGFEYLGIEIDEHYFKLATERLEAEKAQMSLFNL